MYLCSGAEDWLTLSFLPGLGGATIRRLAQAFAGPEAALQRGAQVQNVPGVGARAAAILSDSQLLQAARQRARQEMERLARSSISLLSFYCSHYPELLRSLPDPPVLLYCRGELTRFASPAVAVIGSRAATDYGRRISGMLANELSSRGIVVVSGGAYGIDAAAHRGALQGEGRTIAVLGCGLDVVYPRSHAALFQEIGDKGLLLSEYPLGTPPEGFRFPARNRIISGLAQGVVVVEATEKSGSLITARFALDQGREVFAVPGRIDAPQSVGTHRLIQQGAHLVHEAGDIVEVLAWGGYGAAPVRQQEGGVDCQADASVQEQRLLAFLDAYPRDIDTLAHLAGMTIDELHGLLLQLELKGHIRQLPGQLYERVANS